MARRILIIILLLIPLNLSAANYLSTDDWIREYIKPCIKNQRPGIQCFDNTRKMFKQLSKHRSMITGYLKKYDLPLWIGTIPIIESEFNYYAESLASAIGLWQIMPTNLIYYLTTKTNNTGTFLGWERTVIIIKRPTRKKAVKLGKDPKISTEIACKMLAHLYNKYRNHKLVKKSQLDKVVVMAYNAGETRIDKWLRGEGKPLKPETINYYFQLLAIQELIDDIENGNGFGLK